MKVRHGVRGAVIAIGAVALLIAPTACDSPKNACSDANPCVAELAVGSWFTCAELTDHRVFCWGRNAEDELGYSSANLCPLGDSSGNVTPTACQNFPLETGNAAGAQHVFAGAKDACLLASDGTVRCWGDDTSSQLGDGTTLSSLTPVTVAGVSGATRVAIGGRHACALTGTSVVCWGANDSKQTGNPSADSVTKAAMPVAGLPPVTDIVAGDVHTCALTADGEVWCWGDDGVGELGRGKPNATPSAVPQAVVTDAAGTHLAHVTAIASNYHHTCAVRDDGSVLCWGEDGSGQLGTSSNPSGACGSTQCRAFASAVLTTVLLDAGAPPPKDAGGDAGGGDAGANAGPQTTTGPAFASAVKGVATGWSHTCALLADGTARCWGFNGSGELGAGPGPKASDPQPVLAFAGASRENLLRDVVSLRASGATTCALSSQNAVRCWGWNAVGQLGIGTLDTPAGPTSVAW